MEQQEPEKPPIFGNWSAWYLFTLLVLAAQVVIYYLITEIYK